MAHAALQWCALRDETVLQRGAHRCEQLNIVSLSPTIPAGFLVVLEKPNRSSCTFTFTFTFTFTSTFTPRARGLAARRQLSRAKRCAVKIQRWYKRLRATWQVRQAAAAATVLAAAWRGSATRKGICPAHLPV
jgi:hypothetical protein